MHKCKSFTVFFYLLCIKNSEAYINPSAGSYFIQIFAAFILMIFFQISIFFKGRKRNTISYTKSGHLNLLKDNFPSLLIPPFFIITFEEFQNNKTSTIQKIKSFSKNEDLIIRSSYSDEDIRGDSNAGKYLSSEILSPLSDNKIEKVVLDVFHSKKKISKNDHVIVQKYIKRYLYKGVFFSRILERKSPMKADRRHFHHLLLNFKLSPFQIIVLTLTIQLLMHVSGVIFESSLFKILALQAIIYTTMVLCIEIINYIRLSRKYNQLYESIQQEKRKTIQLSKAA